jgi:hypothetical protein
VDKLGSRAASQPLTLLRVQGEWRREPYPNRQYEPISTYVPADVYDPTDFDEYLTTRLDGFLGERTIFKSIQSQSPP